MRARLFFDSAGRPVLLRANTGADTDELRLYIWDSAGQRSAMFVLDESISAQDGPAWILRERSLWTRTNQYEMSLFTPFYSAADPADLTALLLSPENDVGRVLVEGLGEEPVLPRPALEEVGGADDAADKEEEGAGASDITLEGSG